MSSISMTINDMKVFTKGWMGRLRKKGDGSLVVSGVVENDDWNWAFVLRLQRGIALVA